MVNPTVHRQFAALGDPTRLAIVERLARGPTSAGDLAAPTTLSLPAVLKHVHVLEVGRAALGRLDARRPAAALGLPRPSLARVDLRGRPPRGRGYRLLPVEGGTRLELTVGGPSVPETAEQMHVGWTWCLEGIAEHLGAAA